MNMYLDPKNMYGHWTHCDPKVCEFQQGTIMVYVEYNDEYMMNHRLAAAQKTIDMAFDDAASALAYASVISGKQHPEFWNLANRLTLKQSPLSIYSIRYALLDDSPVYEISWNLKFQNVSVDLPDNDDFIYVQRIGYQQYQHVA